MTQTDRDTPVTALRRLVAALDARGLEGPDWTTTDVERRWAEMDAELVAATDNARAALASSDDVAGSGERLREAALAIKAEHDAEGHREPCALCDALAAPTTEAPPKDALEDALEDDRLIEMAKALAPILRQAEDDIATVHPRGTPLSHAPLFLADRLAAAGVWAITTLREAAPTTEAPPKDAPECKPQAHRYDAVEGEPYLIRCRRCGKERSV